MTHDPDVLKRLAPLSGAPSHGFEDLLRLRAKRELARKIGAIAVATVLVVGLVGVGLGAMRDDTVPAIPPDGSHPGTFTGFVIRYTGDVFEGGGDLIAEDPSTGEVITVLSRHRVEFASASADGGWVAFEDVSCDDNSSITPEERQSGLWVTNGTDEPRQLTTPCLEDTETDAGLWSWSSSDSRLAAVEGGDRLILFDLATGDRTDLGQTDGDVTSLAWSPKGNRIAYATVPTGSPDGTTKGSVYVVNVDDGEHALIAGSLGYVPGGEEGSGIAWSPGDTRIAVLADADDGYPRGTLYVMNADGSGRRPLAENHVLIEHVLGSPNIVWSPDGARIAYATLPDERDHLRIWSAALDGSGPVLVFDDAENHPNRLVGGPVWSPDGTRIAFRYGSNDEGHRWLIANADGSGDVHQIDELQPLSWRASWYFCECFG